MVPLFKQKGQFSVYFALSVYAIDPFVALSSVTNAWECSIVFRVVIPNSVVPTDGGPNLIIQDLCLSVCTGGHTTK